MHRKAGKGRPAVKITNIRRRKEDHSFGLPQRTTEGRFNQELASV